MPLPYHLVVGYSRHPDQKVRTAGMDAAPRTILPKARSTRPRFNAPRNPPQHPANHVYGARRQRVLVAEDEERVLRFMALKLKASGYDVLMAKDGAEALEQVRAQPLDLIVLDLAMPRKDGFETLIELRSFSRLPVIVVTALETDESAVLDLGADDYLSKPFNPRELVDRIKALL